MRRRSLRRWLLIAGFVAAPQTAHPEPRAAELDPAWQYSHAYEFGADWFSQNIPRWSAHLAHLMGAANLRYLEVGPYEDRSFFWVLEKVLTHPGSRATAIDIFWADPAAYYEEGYEYRFRHNLQLSGASERVTVIKGPSQLELRKLPLESFDLIYIDGSHSTGDVLTDAVLSWQLLKVGGTMIFDDYVWHEDWPAGLTPRLAIDAFLAAFSNEIEEISRGVQVFVRKTPNPCEKLGFEGCSRLGAYVYDWRHGELYRGDTLERVELAVREKRALERLFRAKQSMAPGAGESGRFRRDPIFIQLNEKLGLGL